MTLWRTVSSALILYGAVGKWSYREVLTVYTIHSFHLLLFVDVVANLFWPSFNVLLDYSINTESVDAWYSQTVAPTKSYYFPVHTNLPVMSCIVDLLDYLLYQLVLFFQCCGIFLSILCRRTHFKLRLELSMKSCQLLTLYCQTPRRRRTCSESLQYTRSVVCLKNGENSAPQLL